MRHSRAEGQMMRATKFLAIVLVLLGWAAVPARAEVELSFYTGIQEAPHSRVRGNDPGGVGTFNFLSTWEGRSFEPPPHYGFRATWWRDERWGFGLDFNHTKVYADDATLAANGFTRLELTDGLNILTANVWRRWQMDGSRWTPYVGAGVGLAIPHVDVQTAGGKTFGYQVTGPAVMWAAGAQFELNESWSLFGEYKGTYSENDADLDNGGNLKTNIVTNALNIGVAFRF